MKRPQLLKNKLVYLNAFLLIVLTSCIYSDSPPLIKKIYTNKKISSYGVKSIAVLPVSPDDSTDSGTYFSTNHLYNILYDDYSSIELADIDWVRSFDNSMLKKEVEKIKIIKRFDIDSFYTTDLGYNLIEEGYDAAIMGKVDTVDNYYGFYLELNNGSLTRGWITSCTFTYYLVSLKNGIVLWSAECKSEAFNYMSNFLIKNYPPVDNAISNGIDKMVEVLPEGIFKKK